MKNNYYVKKAVGALFSMLMVGSGMIMSSSCVFGEGPGNDNPNSGNAGSTSGKVNFPGINRFVQGQPIFDISNIIHPQAQDLEQNNLPDNQNTNNNPIAQGFQPFVSPYVIHPPLQNTIENGFADDQVTDIGNNLNPGMQGLLSLGIPGIVYQPIQNANGENLIGGFTRSKKEIYGKGLEAQKIKRLLGDYQPSAMIENELANQFGNVTFPKLKEIIEALVSSPYNALNKAPGTKLYVLPKFNRDDKRNKKLFLKYIENNYEVIHKYLPYIGFVGPNSEPKLII